MTLTPLTAISTIDGRYRRTTEPLADYFSEQALIRFRTMVEVEYFIALCEIPLPQLDAFPQEQYEPLRRIVGDFSGQDAQRVKDIEKETNHDVKAVEYFLKEAFDDLGIGAFKEFIHFGLTSQDVTNTAVPLSLKAAWYKVLQPIMEQLVSRIENMAGEWKPVVMLARTHGQPASPTSLGKELYVFADRLREQLHLIEQIPFSAKFGGATGNWLLLPVIYVWARNIAGPRAGIVALALLLIGPDQFFTCGGYAFPMLFSTLTLWLTCEAVARERAGGLGGAWVVAAEGDIRCARRRSGPGDAPAVRPPKGPIADRALAAQAAVAQQAEHRWQQGQRRQHSEDHDRDRPHGLAAVDVRRHDEEPQQANDHRAPGEQHCPACRSPRPCDRSLLRKAALPLLTVPVDDEQRVVDPHRQPDHRHNVEH